ncbi:MAG: SH3 domain-containing protein [Anaerolineae bacterium]|nr:SH3 domain-containing protein [Anaerolineae bacterium]
MKTRAKVLSLVVLVALLTAIFPVSQIAAQRASFVAPVMVVNTSFLNVRTGPGIQYSVLVTVVGGTALPVLGVAQDRVWYQVSTVVGAGWVNAQYVLPRGDFSNVPFVDAPPAVDPRSLAFTAPGTTPNDDTAVDLGFSNRREFGASIIIEHPLRAQPTINAVNLTMLGPDPGIIFTINGATFAEGIQWLQISTPEGLSGWVEASKTRLRPYGCTLSVAIAQQDLELKRGPDGSGPNGGLFISAFDEAYVLDRVGDLLKIELSSGNFGWVEIGALTIRQAGEVRVPYCQQGGAASRAGAFQQPGTSTGGTSGISVPPGVATLAIPRVVINTGFLNVRSGPGAQYTAVATVAGGTELPVLGIAPDRVWYLVQGTFGQGWVNSEFTLFRGDGSRLPIIRGVVGIVATPRGVINGANVLIYAAPNLTLGTVGQITGPVEVDVVARTADFNWVQIRASFGFGWVQAAFITLSGDTGQIPVIGG